MSQLLTFLQKENTGVITIMTSNDVSQLPPELTRAGRIDTQWMFDLPTEEERREIISIYFKKNNLTADPKTLETIAKETENFTGAEIKSAVKDMLINSFYRQKNTGNDSFSRNVIINDAREAIENTVTVWKSSREKIENFRSHARSRYLNASRIIEEPKKKVSPAPKERKTATFSFLPNKKKEE